MGLMKAVGWLLLLAGVVWVVGDLRAGFPRTRRLDVVTNTVGFEGSPKLPAAAIQSSLNDAKGKVESRVACSDWYGTGARFADWTAFFLTAIITLIGGVLGVAAPAGASLPDLQQITGRSTLLGRIVLFLAALAAVVTAAGSKAQTTADTVFKLAQEMQATTAAVRKDVQEAKTDGEARAALDRLGVFRGGCETR